MRAAPTFRGAKCGDLHFRNTARLFCWFQENKAKGTDSLTFTCRAPPVKTGITWLPVSSLPAFHDIANTNAWGFFFFKCDAGCRVPLAFFAIKLLKLNNCDNLWRVIFFGGMGNVKYIHLLHCLATFQLLAQICHTWHIWLWLWSPKQNEKKEEFLLWRFSLQPASKLAA